MTHFQELFVQNLRFYRKKKRISQLKFSELINVSPNYFNAVENGRNFPSPEVIQSISDTLGILPCQLFLESPAEREDLERGEEIIRDLTQVKQRLVKEVDDIIRKFT
jgi:transcriptional regulator with XRE-family HTH domain